MYAVISAGGKQYRVTEGQTVDVEFVGAGEGEDVELRPVLVVDGDTVLATPDELAKVKVVASVAGTTKGPKINGFTYKPKANVRRRYGHRQGYHTLTIRSITKG